MRLDAFVYHRWHNQPEIRHETVTNEERIIRINRSVAIWSNGPDGINSWGDGDDITSWNR